MSNSNKNNNSEVGDALKNTVPAIVGTIASALITVLIKKKW